MYRKFFKRISAKSTIRYLLKIFLISALYFIAGKSGLKLGPVSTFATLVWPPTGISFAALLLFGSELWPGVAIGAFLVNYVTGASLPVASGITLGNTLEAIIGVFLVQKFFNFSPRLERLKDALALIVFAALGSTLISATIGTTSLLLGNKITLSAYPITWITWWVGDMLGDLIIAPLILTWLSSPKVQFTFRKAISFVIIFLLLTCISLFVFDGFLGIDTRLVPIEYLIIPPLILIALQYGQRSSVTAMLLVSTIAIWGTVEGYGVFAGHRLSDSLLFLQGFIGVNACTFLILSAVVSESKELEARKDAFVALAAHELKTPVTSIKMFTYMLFQRFKIKSDRQSAQILSKLDKQIDRQTDLVSDLLDISRIQAGKLEYHMENVLLDELVAEIIENMQTITKSHKLILKGHVAQAVFADRNRISQVLINLIVNAIKYSPQAHKVLISVTKNKRNMRVSVQDFGMGIARSDRERIFDRFFQASNKLKQTYPGLGLGLYITSEIVRQHHGKIWVNSVERKGSTFFFTLPVSAKQKIL
jgi:signal transduction histidine kinase